MPDQILKFYARLKYIKISSSVFNKSECSLKGKVLFQKLMRECEIKNAVTYNAKLTAFGCAKKVVLTNLQKLLIENFVEEEIDLEVFCYERFILNQKLFHASSYKRLKKRINSVVKTIEGRFFQ